MATVKKTVSSAAKRTPRPTPLPTDFIALGSKTKDHRNQGNDGGASYRVPPNKKPKPSGQQAQHHHLLTPLGRLSAAAESASGRMSPTIPDTTAPCIDCPPPDLVYKVLKYIDSNHEHVQGLLCGAIRNLRANRLKPDTTVVLSLLYLAKIHPKIFNTEYVVESLCNLLKRDVGHDYMKSKINNIMAIISCKILMNVLQNDEDWPSLIVKVFLDDAFNERIWVDHPECRQFVMNISTAFSTISNQKREKEDETSEIDIAIEKDAAPRFRSTLDHVQNLTTDIIKERLSRRQNDSTVSGGAVTGSGVQSGLGVAGKHLIKTLIATCGLQEVRILAIQRLEMWLQNPKLSKPAQDLLYAICVNCNTHLQGDVDVIGHMSKIRLKLKLLNHYNLCMKELIAAHPDNLKTMFSYVLYNELSNSRNINNMAVITATLKNYPDSAAKTLASVCQDLLLQQDDYLRAVRGLLREIVRSACPKLDVTAQAKHEIQFASLALGLMQEPDMEKFSQLDQSGKVRYISATAELICLTMLLSVTPQAKEAIHVINGKKKAADSFLSNVESTYAQFKFTLAEMQHDALWWLHVIVVPQLATRMLPSDFIQLIHQVLFMKPPETYHTRDNWLSEADRSFTIKSCQDAAVLEGSILRLAAIGLSQDHPLAPSDALDLIGLLVKRAAGLAHYGFNPLAAERVDVIDTLLALCQYHHPGNIRLPPEYVPPSLAISQLYWKALQTLLVILSFNATTIAQQAWSHYPMLKVLMEMSIVNRFSYPPVTIVDEDVRNQMIGKEHQMALVEKSEILEFESHLAAATTRLIVTEESSLLLSQLIAMDSQGHSRRPPDSVLKQVAALSSHLQLGVWLCRSRQPDFLLEIINRHGENQAITWLPDLVASTKGDVGLLPVQCLCEFLLVHDSESEKLSSGGIHINELVSQLRKLLISENLEDSLQVKQYFLKRLYSPQKVMRERARKALSLVLDNDEAMEVDNVIASTSNIRWLLFNLSELPHYTTIIRTHVIEAIQAAVLIETDPLYVIAYIKFLANDMLSLNPHEEAFSTSTTYALMASHLLTERRILVESAIMMIDEKLLSDDDISAAENFVVSLLQIFLVHLRQAQEHDLRRRLASDEVNDDRMPWSDSQDEIYVKWPNNFGAATLHILVPQASIILLGFGPPSRISDKRNEPCIVDHDSLYNDLMNMWFSEEGYIIPQAYLMDTQEEALLVPDWLRLKMLRSEVMPSTTRLAFAAVRDLEVEQLILFVQSFGIPVESMNLLLEILDSQCTSNADVILNATSSNTNFMSRLVDVQKMRGCKAGSKLAELLKSVCEDSSGKAGKKSPTCVIDLVEGSSDSAMEVDAEQSDDFKLPQDDAEMTKLLKQLFLPKGANNEWWNLLLQYVNQTKDFANHTAVLCVRCLNGLVFTDVTTDFVSSLYSCPSRACSLLRALNRVIYTSKRMIEPEINNQFREVVCQIRKVGKSSLDKMNARSHALFALISSWKLHEDGAKKGRGPRRMSSTSEQSNSLRQSDWSKLEEFLREQLAFLDNDEEIKLKVTLVAQILLEEIYRRTLLSRGKLSFDDDYFTSIGTTGLLVDWLQLLDPELLAHRPSLQRKLLFESGRNDQSILNSKAPVFDQAYLLSLLAEHCNWENIHNSIRWLLSDSTSDPTVQTVATNSSVMVDAKTALDFLWVVIQIPKIWQGRENKSTSVSEQVYQLTSSQFFKLLSYVAAASVSQKLGDSDPNYDKPVDSSLTTQQRTTYIDLFSVYFSKFGQDSFGRNRVCNIGKFLKKKIQSTASQSPYFAVWSQLLAQLHVLHPHLSLWDSILTPDSSGFTSSELEKFSDTVSSINVGSNCRTDALVCSLLNRLGYVRSGATLENRVGSSVSVSNLDSAFDANLILTKMANSRPFLILRQLPLLSAMLRGRTRHEFKEFKVQHHLSLMLNAVGILQQLCPYVFRPLHATYLYDLMEIFWQMIRNYCDYARRQMLPVLLKTLSLTHNYLRHLPVDASKILTKHQQSFQMLNKTYQDHDNVVALINALQSSISTWSQLPDSNTPLSGSVRPSVLPQSMSIIPSNEQASSMHLELMATDQDLENITQVLADFDESSKRRIDNIAPYISELCNIFSKSRDPSARKSALAAALRHARAFPESAKKELYSEYISCLRGSRRVQQEESKRKRKPQLSRFTSSAPDDWMSLTISRDVASCSQDALQFLPDMVILCRESASTLLGAAFDTGSKCGAAYSYPRSCAGESTDITDVIAKSLWLLSGLSESDMKSTAST